MMAMNDQEQGRNLLVTGAGGYIGRLLIEELTRDRRGVGRVVATDLRLPPADDRAEGIDWRVMDVRSRGLTDLLRQFRIDVVVHLAAIVTPGRRSNRELEYSVDVLGTENVLEASLAAGVRQLVVTSSGAAYGYHADNPAWLTEDDDLRGNESFAYSHHKRLVEQRLARAREQNPELSQLILRSGTILGAATRNQITDIFDKPVVLGLRGADSPFVIIWDHDVVGAILAGVTSGRSGVYNLAGDGTLTLREIAQLLGKPYLELPPALVGGALRLLKPLGLSQYGPEQLDFLRYRPVLDNTRLKEEFGYTPRKTTREAFEYYMSHGR